MFRAIYAVETPFAPIFKLKFPVWLTKLFDTAMGIFYCNTIRILSRAMFCQRHPMENYQPKNLLFCPCIMFLD